MEKTKLVLPAHVGIIMDGNGRWAKKRFLPRPFGHKAGAENFRKITEYCHDIGIRYLTYYAFSTENWKRSEDEVLALMRLLKEYLLDYLTNFSKKMNIRFLGDRSVLDRELQELMEQIENQDKNNTTITVNIAINYGGRDEICRTVRKIASLVKEGKLDIDTIDEAAISRFLDTASQPDVDLLIRTGGECRISNFLIWQSSYAEFIFTDVLWPDFSPGDMDKAIEEYSKRNRRFGGVKN